MEWNEDSTSVINPFFKGPLLEEKRECHTVGSVAQEVTVSFSLSVFFVPFYLLMLLKFANHLES